MIGTGGTDTCRVTLTGPVRHEPVPQLAAVAPTDGPDDVGDEGSADEAGPGEGVRFAAGMLVAHDETAASTAARAAVLRSRACSKVWGLRHGYSFVARVPRSQSRGRVWAVLALRITGTIRDIPASFQVRLRVGPGARPDRTPKGWRQDTLAVALVWRKALAGSACIRPSRRLQQAGKSLPARSQTIMN